MSVQRISRRQFLLLLVSFVGSRLLQAPRVGSAIEHPRETTSLRRGYGNSGYGQGQYGTGSAVWTRKE